MFRRLIIAIFLLCLPVAAMAKSPMETLKASQNKLDETLQNAPEKGTPEAKKRRSTLEAEAKKLFDFETLAQKALGKNWDTGTAEQQQEFVSLFSELVRGTYLNQIEGNSAKGFTVTWGSEDISGDTANVKASVGGKTAEGKDVNIKMVYKMILRDSNWMVYDVVTDDSSLLDTYKDTFSKMFKKEGSFDGVLIKLRAKTGHKAPVVKAETPAEVVAPKEPVKPAPVVTEKPKANPTITEKPADALVKKIPTPAEPLPTTAEVKSEKAPKEIVNILGVFFYQLPVAAIFSVTKSLPHSQEFFVNTMVEQALSFFKIFTMIPTKTI